ncbi:unnamed protein product [Rotaria magnacalcarata]|uniref:acid phosphatase n=1 Tax=Rotaria magnacalcarata TaxID=392030 RepID=A0A815W5C5_9BILA|nr:unnamed protein product [Rotaria magnacalcarata]CAF3842759.1 unnamed protein product [Rotaria magnacalcarata]CAF3994721.1 unnamed protein product [Rotaria magnacalcarata]CAF4020238.1 unnamed protein product [Rotaria magnacalcarata]CAF4038563.1 unnamed protein product [Rotaria magnacalcarata]
MLMHIGAYLFVLINQIVFSQQKINLVGTHIIYRHGDRSPAFTYPNSITNEFFWTNGFGQLTRRGQLQQVRLGQYFRERYGE